MFPMFSPLKIPITWGFPIENHHKFGWVCEVSTETFGFGKGGVQPDVSPWGVQPENGDSSWINSGLLGIDEDWWGWGLMGVLLSGYLWHSSGYLWPIRWQQWSFAELKKISIAISKYPSNEMYSWKLSHCLMTFHSYSHSTTRFLGFSIARNVWTIRMDINEMMGLEWKNVGWSNSFTCMGYPLVNSHIAMGNQHL